MSVSEGIGNPVYDEDRPLEGVRIACCCVVFRSNSHSLGVGFLFLPCLTSTRFDVSQSVLTQLDRKPPDPGYIFPKAHKNIGSFIALALRRKVGSTSRNVNKMIQKRHVTK